MDATGGSPARTSTADELDTRDFLDYLKAKGASGLCSSCEKNDWSLLEPRVSGLTNIGLWKGGLHSQQQPSSLIPAFVMVCRNCGLVRMHAGLPVTHWKQQKTEDSSGNR